jgi:hypothetical protein
MAYHLARILRLDFGYEGWVVTVQGETPDHGVFTYDPQFPAIELAELPECIEDQDILIANPSFSAHMLGMRCRGRKVMYAQGFSTYDLLDCRFDLYVSVSGFVQNFLRSVYGIATEVIPPFLQSDLFPAVTPWRQRAENSVLLHNKNPEPRRSTLAERLLSLIRSQRPDIDPCPLSDGGKLPQQDFTARLGQTRYLLSLGPAEGFGLIPLEAMAMGTTVVGFDGFGGRDFMRPGENCASVAWPQIERLAEQFLDLLDDPARAEALAVRGMAEACAPLYGYARFRSDWCAQFQRLLNDQP